MKSNSQLGEGQERILGQRHMTRTRHVISDETWEFYREDLCRIYVAEKNNLKQTIQLMEDTHNFKASVRKYKMKLKEWNFTKNIPATEMKAVLDKDQKRASQEGKQTVFYHDGQEISKEKIENFRKRMILYEEEIESPFAATPANITYHTPAPDSDGSVLDLVDETDIYVANGIHNDNFGHSQPTAAADMVDQLLTKEVEEVSPKLDRQTGVIEDESIQNSTPRSGGLSTEETRSLDCGHQTRGSIAEAFKEHLRVLRSDHSLPILKILYGLANTCDSPRRLDGNPTIHCSNEGPHREAYGISVLKRLRAISHHSTLREFYDRNQTSSPYVIRYHQSVLLGGEGEGLESAEKRNCCNFCRQDEMATFIAMLAKYKELGQWPEAFLAMAVLRDYYFELKQWDDLSATMSEMRKVLDKNFEMDQNFTSDILFEAIDLAGTYSALHDFSSAHSVFSSVFPKLWLLDDTKHDSEILYGYLEFGLHYKRQALWSEAYEYLSLAHKGLAGLGISAGVGIMGFHLDTALNQMFETSCIKAEKIKRDQLELIEMGRIKVLLRTINPGRTWKTTMKAYRTRDDFEPDITSCKYGVTYSVSAVTGISDSGFMVP